jgi:SSS family solute:Na+ symporter
MVVIVGVSLNTSNGDDDPKGIPLLKETFATGKKFNISAYIILLLISVLYIVFW